MHKRDLTILVIAVVSGLLAFLLVLNLFKRPASQRQSVVRKIGSGSLAVPQGLRAFTLSTKELESIPPALKAGDYMDVLGMAPNYEGAPELQTIIRSAQVINVEKPKDKSDQIESITLALTPVGTEVVMKAKTQGKIQLVLRPEHDQGDPYQLGNVGLTEVIRGVNKEKNVRMER